MSIHNWIKDATSQLIAAGIGTAKLDAEIILAHTINQPRTYVHMYGERELDPSRRDIADARLALRTDRVPIAYIIGHKEFYGRRFTVSPSVLIPRPESEAMIELLAKIEPNGRLVDVGCGSGALGITAKLEHPELDVTLLDISTHALKIAEKNATTLGADVATLKSDLLGSYPLTPDIILANLPYVDPEWEVDPELRHEPVDALFASEQGLSLIRRLLEQSQGVISNHGHIFIEADRRQHDTIRELASQHNLTQQQESGLILHFSS